MSILQGMMPSDAARARLPRVAVPVQREAVIRPIARVTLRDQAIALLRANPLMPFEDVRAKIGARSISPVSDAIATLKSRGELPARRRTTLNSADRKALIVLRECPHSSTAELAAKLRVSDAAVRARVRRLEALGLLKRDVRVVYTWVVTV